MWIDRRYVPAGYGWSFPAGDELRIGVGSFDPRFHVREPTVRLAEDLGADTVRYQGNWIPHALRPATEDGVFFVGDSAGHCLPLTAEGIRTALYFGLACGRELRRVLAGEQTREQALVRYHQFSASHATPFRWMLRVQRLVPRIAPRLLSPALGAIDNKRFVDWSFNHYLDVAHPEFAAAGGSPGARRLARGPGRGVRPRASHGARPGPTLKAFPVIETGFVVRVAASTQVHPYGGLAMCLTGASQAGRRTGSRAYDRPPCQPQHEEVALQHSKQNAQRRSRSVALAAVTALTTAAVAGAATGSAHTVRARPAASRRYTWSSTPTPTSRPRASAART